MQSPQLATDRSPRSPEVAPRTTVWPRAASQLMFTLLIVPTLGSIAVATELREQDSKAQVNEPVPAAPDDQPEPLKPLPEKLQKLVADLPALSPDANVFLDRKKGRVLLRTQVVCQDCLLEMLCSTERHKSHESILWLRSKALFVHTALLTLNIEPGSPTTFRPEFAPVTGPKIAMFVNWIDKDGKVRRVDARRWIRTSVNRYFAKPLHSAPPNVELPLMELRYDKFNKELLWFGPMTVEQKEKLLKLWDDETYTAAIESFYADSQSRPMTADFIFGGSYHFTNEATGERIYAAEGGSLICVANFASAMIDIKEVSSASDGSQSYESWPEKVPPLGTPVILELVPERDETKKSTESAKAPTNAK